MASAGAEALFFLLALAQRWKRCATQRQMQITEIYKFIAGRVDLRGAGVCIRAADGMQSAVLVVRQRVYVSGRSQDGDRSPCWRKVSALSPRGGLVEITGGEPCCRNGSCAAHARLLDAGTKC